MSIFQETSRLEDCNRVLAALATTDHDDEEYLLHDRSREQHAKTVGKPYGRDDRRRADGHSIDWSIGRTDHGGPFVPVFLGKEGNYNCLTALSYLVMKAEKAKPQDVTNTRYSKFRLSEIKEYLIADLLWAMDHYDLRKHAAEEAHLPEEWRAQVAKHYPEYSETRKVRIDHTKGVFTVSLLDPSRANIRGFGVFMEDIQAGEVSLSPEAKQVLSTIGEQHCGGLPSLSLWEARPNGPILAGLFGFQTKIHESQVSMPALPWAALNRLAVVEP